LALTEHETQRRAKMHGRSSRADGSPQVPIKRHQWRAQRRPGTAPVVCSHSGALHATWARDIDSLSRRLACRRKSVSAHLLAKHELFEEVHKKTGLQLDPPDFFTMGLPRRRPGNKRAYYVDRNWTGCSKFQNAGKFQIVLQERRTQRRRRKD